MINIILLTGFLGAGKTTLLQRMLNIQSQHRIGVIVNDFGEINVDARLIRREGIQLMELSNGSIFCACIKNKFANGLIEMSRHPLDYLFIEASGLSDPANMQTLLEGLQGQMECPMVLYANICVADAEYFLDMVHVMPALAQQVRYADVVIVNKVDLAGQELLEATSQYIQGLNPGVMVYCTSFCRADLEVLLAHLKEERLQAGDSTNTPSSRPSTFTLHSDTILELERLEKFLQAIAPFTYRLKGFAMTNQGPKEVSTVGPHIRITDWSVPLIKTELVAISSVVGIKLVSIILAANRAHLDEQLKL